MLPILHQSLWRDEAFSVLLAEKTPFEIIQLTIKDSTPPFHYLVLHYWMLLFGNSEVVARSLSFIFHILTAIVIFFIARKLIKSTIAQTLISLATLLNPFLLQYAFEARTYSLLAFLTVLAVYFMLAKKIPYMVQIVVLYSISSFNALNFFINLIPRSFLKSQK